MCVTEWWTFRPCGSLSLHKHCETQPCAERIDGHFRTVGLSLKFHPSAFVVLSEGREDKQVHMYKEIIPGPAVRTLRQHRAEKSLNSVGSEFKAPEDFVTQLSFLLPERGFFFRLSARCQRIRGGKPCRSRQRSAYWSRISHCLDIFGKFTRGQSRWTPTPSKTCPGFSAAKAPTLSAPVRAPLLREASDTNPLTPCR